MLPAASLQRLGARLVSVFTDRIVVRRQAKAEAYSVKSSYPLSTPHRVVPILILVLLVAAVPSHAVADR
jgi:hypothetical protein